jgi:Beta-galactosidase/Fibronectin type III domain
MKNMVKKLNVKPCENRNLMTSDYSALSRQTALILAAVLLSWCAIALGTNTAYAGVPAYPKGIWAAAGVDDDLPPELVNNLGVVGIGVSEDWNVVNPAPGVYDWTQLDSRVANAKAAGFRYIALAVTDSSENTPQWLLDLLPPDQKIGLLDNAEQHTTFCQNINTALYWNPVFHQARLDLIAAAGAHYTNDPAIVATNAAAFANHNSNDWNIQDFIGSVQCPRCPQPPPTLCGTQIADQVQQWMDAGWTEQQMLQVGKEICDAAAAAFPNQNIKLPIGGLTDNRMSTPDGNPAHGNYTQLARDIENYVYGNADLGIPPQPYANRFYMQRNTFTATWKNGDYYDTYTPPFEAEGYIKYMIRNHAKPASVGGLTPGQAGLQMVTAAMLGTINDCRLGGGPDGPCGPICDPVCVLQTTLDIARTYNTDFIEIFPQDGQNPDFYAMITAATIAMGGRPRGMPSPTPTPTATPPLLPPTATSATNVTSSGFTANWTAVSGAIGYSLDVSTQSDFSRYIGGYRKRDVGNVRRWSVTGLRQNKTYYYRVRAYDSSRISDNSNVIAVTTDSN